MKLSHSVASRITLMTDEIYTIITMLCLLLIGLVALTLGTVMIAGLVISWWKSDQDNTHRGNDV